MAHKLLNRKFYDAVRDFERSEAAQDYYYSVMDSETGKTLPDGRRETIRDQLLRVYGMLFCDDIGLAPGAPAGVDEVAATADRLYIGDTGFDPRHWYRMHYHFPVIDEDNYDRFVALVIADLNAGPLREAAEYGGETLLVGAADPLHMTREEREKQQIRRVDFFAEKGGTDDNNRSGS